MDPVSLSASIVGLVGFGLQVAQCLDGYVGSAADSKDRIKAISNDIGLTIRVFEILNDQTREEISRKMINADAEKIAKEAIDMCNDILKKLLHLLPFLDSKQRKRDIITKLKWPFLEPKLEILRGNLEKIKATLQLLISVISFAAMTKMHADKEVLKEQENEIGRLLADKMKAEADLESLKQRYYQAEFDNISSRPSPPMFELITSPPGTDNAIIGATSIVGGSHSMPSIPLVEEADRDISRSEDLHSLCDTVFGAASNHNLSADGDSESDFEPVDPPYMDELHADYSACLLRLKALQSTLEKALQKMYVPGSYVAPTANPSHDWRLRLKYTRTIENSTNRTMDVLRERIAESKVHRQIRIMAEEEVSSIIQPHLIVEMYSAREMKPYAARERKASTRERERDPFRSYAPSDPAIEFHGRYDDIDPSVIPSKHVPLSHEEIPMAPGTAAPSRPSSVNHTMPFSFDNEHGASDELFSLPNISEPPVSPRRSSSNTTRHRSLITARCSGTRKHITRPVEYVEETPEGVGETIEYTEERSDGVEETKTVLPTVEDLVRQWTNLYDDENDGSTADDASEG